MNEDEFMYQYYNQMQFKWKWEKRNLTVNFAHGLELMYEGQLTGETPDSNHFKHPSGSMLNLASALSQLAR